MRPIPPGVNEVSGLADTAVSATNAILAAVLVYAAMFKLARPGQLRPGSVDSGDMIDMDRWRPMGGVVFLPVGMSMAR